MFRNYVKIAFRNLTKHKLYSIINIGGLSIGIGACLLILLYITHEHSYDNFHQYGNRIYRASAKIKMGSDSISFSGMNYATAGGVSKADPSIESALRMQDFTIKKVVANPADPGKKFTETHFYFADSNFFRFFSFHLKAGDPDQVLARPMTVVITEEAAHKYFGNADPIGKTLRYDSAYLFEITGIVDKAPSNSSIQYDFIASLSSQEPMKTAEGLRDPSVSFGNYATYFRLRKGVNPAKVENSILQLANRNKDHFAAHYRLSPLRAVHSEQGDANSSGSRYLTVFPLVAGLILLLALINYMNLTTAPASLRAKEIGVRKTNGASRSRIAQQFYVESAIYALLSFAAGLLLFQISLPYFCHIMQLRIDTSFIYRPAVLFNFTALLIITILIAGSYPALLLSAYNPIAVLYGRMSRQRGGAGLRKALSIVQFSVSIVLIISSILIGRQLYFIRHTDTGIQRENVVSIRFDDDINQHYAACKKEIADLPGISGVAMSTFELYTGYNSWGVLLPDGSQNQCAALAVDETFIPMMGVQWKQSPKDPFFYNKEKQLVINEAALVKFQLPADAVGRQIRMADSSFRTVAGVVRDFTFLSLRDKVEPLIMKVNTTQSLGGIDGHLLVKIAPGVNLPTTIEKLKQIYERYDTSHPFDYAFMDDEFNRWYKAEDKLGAMLNLFTGLTVLIACLGLFGLAAFSATQKTKEIGIRKVLGASVQSLVVLLTRDFIRLVVIAIVVAVPIAWYAMHKWLEGFAYRVPVGWTAFALAGAGAIGIALVTVSWEAVRAAVANPAKSLKTE